ncbi:hypothetical protein [Novipirellula artificiosorum]|nr:hypothetical protein [Novipirellula artificiosorum]
MTSVFLSTTLFVAAFAKAGHEPTLYRAADDYRDAVVHFERDVLRLRYVHRDDKRLVDRLEDATSRLRSESRHARDLNRLLYRWEEIQLLHQTVRSALFGRPCYPRNPELAVCWQEVECAYTQYAAAIRFRFAEYEYRSYSDSAQARELLPAEPVYLEPVPTGPVPTDPTYGEPIFQRQPSLSPVAPSAAVSPVRPRSRDYSGFDSDRQPYGSSAMRYESLRRTPLPYGDASPYRFGPQSADARGGRVITIPSGQRVETRSLGAAMIGALLARALD